MRVCPFTNCGRKIESDKFCCIEHWRMCRRDERARIWEAWEMYQADTIDLAKLREVQESVVKSVEADGVQKSRESPCASCGAALIWALTENNKRIPLNAQPNDKGNIVLRGGVAHYLKKAEMEQRDAFEAEERYISHFATCPNAKQHRKAK